MGGSDELSNLVTLCDGCHAAHHPNLAGGLARRVIERWAMRLARWLDEEARALESDMNFGPALRLFGASHFRGGQLPIVLAALAGKSILVVSPTGSGKSLCFQLPALLRRGLTIIVSPLKTLMSDQVSGLLRKKIPATFINSALGSEEKEIRYHLIGKNAVKFLYVAPERFFVKRQGERDALSRSRPEYLVVDEAHCVDQWGRDFRPEYGRLRDVRASLGSPPILAFTATAGQAMQKRILSVARHRGRDSVRPRRRPSKHSADPVERSGLSSSSRDHRATASNVCQSQGDDLRTDRADRAGIAE